ACLLARIVARPGGVHPNGAGSGARRSWPIPFLPIAVALKPSLFFTRRRALLAAALVLAAPLAGAQSFPNRPLKLMVGYAAGGGVDAMARLLAQRLPSVLGQQVVVENRAGASGMIAADAVARAPADGYTLLMGETGMLISSHLQPRANLDPLKSFTPVAGTFVAPLLIVAHNALPAKNPQE